MMHADISFLSPFVSFSCSRQITTPPRSVAAVCGYFWSQVTTMTTSHKNDNDVNLQFAPSGVYVVIHEEEPGQFVAAAVAVQQEKY